MADDLPHACSLLKQDVITFAAQPTAAARDIDESLRVRLVEADIREADHAGRMGITMIEALPEVEHFIRPSQFVQVLFVNEHVRHAEIEAVCQQLPRSL